jgi:deoxyribonuclease (pyrimidine dimer)
MTRINVGVEPSELCDQHLLAEYRELPRLWNFESKSAPPERFCLGKGHVLWCSQYPGMLHDRYSALVEEMHYRGFHVSYPFPPPGHGAGNRPSQAEIQRARALVLARIQERLTKMKRPRYTRRDPCKTSPSPTNSSAA